jgi:thioredoxin-related protein
MKKNILVVLLFLATQYITAQDYNSKLTWETDFELAKSKSAKTKKPILILFTGSDWCAPCKMLKKDFFDSKEFIVKSNEFILLLVDFPRNKELISQAQEKSNKLLSAKYGVKSFPTIIAVNYKGAIIDKIKSYSSSRDTGYHFKFIDMVLKNI